MILVLRTLGDATALQSSGFKTGVRGALGAPRRLSGGPRWISGDRKKFPSLVRFVALFTIVDICFIVIHIVIHKPRQPGGAVSWAVGTPGGGRNSSNYCYCWLLSRPEFLLFSIRSLRRWSGAGCETDSRICQYRIVCVSFCGCVFS